MPFCQKQWKEGVRREERERISFCSCSALVARKKKMTVWTGCYRNCVPLAEVVGSAPNVGMMSYPFDGADSSELQRKVQGNRMEVIFGLVDNGRISLSEAADMAGLGMEEIDDLMSSWRWFEDYRKEGG